METLTFVCARCRYRVLCGLEPWADCPVCSSVGLELDALPPYEPPDEPPPYQPRWHKPYVHEVPPSRYTWRKPQVWWPMREQPYNFLGVDEAKREGRGDTRLGFECFNDSTYSPELRTQMREQLNIAFDLMPDDDWWLPFASTPKRATKS